MKPLSLNQVRKAVIPVAGLGTRLLPFSKEVPKELLPILDTPTIHYIVEEVAAAGIEQVVLVTSKGKSALEDYFDPSPALEAWLEKRGKLDLLEKVRKLGKMCEIIAVRQHEPLGLGHAILCARHAVGNEPFAVCLGDEIFPPWDEVNRSSSPLQRLLRAHQTSGRSAVGVVKIQREQSALFGVVDTAGKIPTESPVAILRTVEKPKPAEAPSEYAILGRYVFNPVLFDELKEVKPGFGGEVQLTDGMDRLCRNSGLDAVLLEGSHYDMASPFGFVTAQIEAALRRPDLSGKLRDYLSVLQTRELK